MIGQVNLLNSLYKLTDNFPKFLILIGEKGSGKKTICKEISRKLSLKLITSGTKISDVRNTIELARTQVDPIIYMFPDADDMSIGAKNCLLKITEEPPKNTYFIMTLRNLDNTLPTIASRAVYFNLDNYSREELIEYRKYRKYSDSFDNVIEKICNTTGDVDELFSYNVSDFYKFVEAIINYIHVPKNGNTFKISNMIKTKDENTGYDFSLVLNAVRQMYVLKALETKKKQYILASLVCSNTLSKLRNTSANRKALCDMWIMDVRSALVGI